MGGCYSCAKSKSRFKDKGSKICSTLQSAVVVASHGEPPADGGVGLVGTSRGPSRSGSSAGGLDATCRSMSNAIKQMVSKRRNRYKKDGFNLDLTYITRNIIAMGYPASNIEGVYRNKIDDVARFLDTEHRDHYRVYNLCSERSYEAAKFHDRVEQFPFDDHNPPRLELIRPFCASVDRWLRLSPKNVAAVHCKAGKGRTGTMICCYLLHSRAFTDPTRALEHYDSKRTRDQKGVTIPSQVRYVHYYARLLEEDLTYTSEVLYVRQLRLEPPPLFVGGQGSVSFSVSQQDNAAGPGGKPVEKYRSASHEVRRGGGGAGGAAFAIDADGCVPVVGDVIVKVYTKKLYTRKQKQFHFWANTFFVARQPALADGDIELVLRKSELDIVNKKDKQNKAFTEDFKVTVVFRRVPRDAARWGASPPRAGPRPPQQPPNQHQHQQHQPHHQQHQQQQQQQRLHQQQQQAGGDGGRPPDATPSCSSGSGDSSPESDDDGWDSAVDVESSDPREFGYRLLSESDLSFPLGAAPGDLLTA